MNTLRSSRAWVEPDTADRRRAMLLVLVSLAVFGCFFLLGRVTSPQGSAREAGLANLPSAAPEASIPIRLPSAPALAVVATPRRVVARTSPAHPTPAVTAPAPPVVTQPVVTPTATAPTPTPAATVPIAKPAPKPVPVSAPVVSPPPPRSTTPAAPRGASGGGSPSGTGKSFDTSG
jgi:hypothetical protein